MSKPVFPPGWYNLQEFSLLDALFGRRSRRFALGATLPDGPLAFTSQQPPLPLSELERMLVLTATGGVTGWHHLLERHPRYAPKLPDYPASAAGRTFPSAAGWQTSELFFTDDQGVYFFATRDAAPSVFPAPDGSLDPEALLTAHRARIRQLADQRLYLPAGSPHMDGHNSWCANLPGSLLIIPVADLAQHMLAVLCLMVQNGACLYDNVHHERIDGLQNFRHLVDVENPAPLSEVELAVITMATAELATSCYAGMLILQAMGLGGWMFTGINWLSVLGASGDPAVPGLGFHYETNSRWTTPNPTGLPGVFTAFCPPHYPDLRAAVDALVERKFGLGGPFHPQTSGPWQETSRVRGSAQPFAEEMAACVAVMAQAIFDRFGKFPGTIPSLYSKTFLQAHHLDLAYYDQHFAPGAYLWTHAQHMADWHPADDILVVV